MISVKYSLTKDDYISYYLYMMWDAPERKTSRLKYYSRQILVNGGIIAILAYTDVFRYNPTTLYIYAGILLLITAMQIFSARINVKKQAQKITDNEGNQSFFVETQFDISEAGISGKMKTKNRKNNGKAL